MLRAKRYSRCRELCTGTKPEAHLEAARSGALSQLRAQDPHEGALVGAQQVVRHRDVPLQRMDLQQMASFGDLWNLCVH